MSTTTSSPGQVIDKQSRVRTATVRPLRAQALSVIHTHTHTQTELLSTALLCIGSQFLQSYTAWPWPQKRVSAQKLQLAVQHHLCKCAEIRWTDIHCAITRNANVVSASGQVPCHFHAHQCSQQTVLCYSHTHHFFGPSSSCRQMRSFLPRSLCSFTPAQLLSSTASCTPCRSHDVYVCGMHCASLVYSAGSNGQTHIARSTLWLQAGRPRRASMVARVMCSPLNITL